MKKLLVLCLLLSGMGLIGCSGGDSGSKEKPLEGKVESTEIQSAPGDSRPGAASGESRDGDK